MIHDSAPLFRKKRLTREAMIRPQTHMIKMEPIRDRSRLVTNPYRLIPPNVPAVRRNAEISTLGEYHRKMPLMSMPMMAAQTRKSTVATLALSLPAWAWAYQAMANAT